MTCRHCGKPIYEPEFGAGYFHVELPTHDHRAEPDLRINAKEEKLRRSTISPPHDASALCQSGAQNHCSCERCF